jgi:Zn-dependent alcohol dehydrogenase
MVDEASYAKVNPKALDKICLLGCGFATGERNLWHLQVVEGCKATCASRINGIDIVFEKLDLGMFEFLCS